MQKDCSGLNGSGDTVEEGMPGVRRSGGSVREEVGRELSLEV